MKKVTIYILLLICLFSRFTLCIKKREVESHLNYLKTEASVEYKTLKKGFENPPFQARLRSFWKWPNSLVTKESITRDLEEFREKGWGGVLINDGGNSSKNYISQEPPWDATGPLYLSDGWKELYAHAVSEADRLGLEITSVMGSGWNPGGPFIPPGLAVKKLVFSEVEIKGGRKVDTELPTPDTLLMYRDILVQAIKNLKINGVHKEDAILNWSLKSLNSSFGAQGNYPLHKLREWSDDLNQSGVIAKDDIQDITCYFDGKRLKWDAPEGDWLIIRYGWTCKGTKTSTTSKGWEGLSMDHLNRDAFKLFSDSVILPIVRTAKSAGNSVKYLWTDSWEMGVTNWTNDFQREFKKFRGYDLDVYMPVLAGRVVESQEVSNRFLHDFRMTVSDCILENHYRPFAELAHEHGIGFHPESGGPHAAPVDALRMMGISDFPMGEFWIRANTHRVSDAARFFVRQSACVAHTNGIRIVGGEGPQCIGPKWERAPKDMKHDLDRAFCSGVNRLFWTNSISSPPEFGLPGVVNFAANHLNPSITWWDQAGDFIRYINRCCFMLQQGLFVADVLVYYGDDVPNFVFLKEEYPELMAGYDWDKCSKDVILNRTGVADGKIVLTDGMSYRVLVLPPEDAIDLNVLRKVEQLVKQGATVLSPRPVRASGLQGYPQSDAEISEIAGRMWGEINGTTITVNQFGKGYVYWGKNINEILHSMKTGPDFLFSSPNRKTSLDYIHRTTDRQEIYFVVNRFAHHGIDDFEYHAVHRLPDRYEDVECSFRVTGKTPELWDPMTGEIRRLVMYREEDGRTIIPLHLKPEASCFIVFRQENDIKVHITAVEKNGEQIFPFGNNHQVRVEPVIGLYPMKGRIMADITESGEYRFHWSDGATSVIKSVDSVQEILIVSPWTVHFDPDWGGPEKVTFSELKSWLESEHPGIKYYSGKAVYVNSFRIDRESIRNRRVMLDLGKVEELAVIRINGHSLPVLWMPPFKADITRFVRDGENKLEVDVVNQWPNRIIGDGKLPVNERYAKTNYLKFYRPDADQYLRESGLIGPVKLQLISTLEINSKP